MVSTHENKTNLATASVVPDQTYLRKQKRLATALVVPDKNDWSLVVFY